MSDAKFTPGPWDAIAPMLVSGGEHPICEIERGEWGDTFPNIRLEGDGLSRVAVPFIDIIPYGDIPMVEAHANAYLIAAAPDMYKALKHALSDMDTVDGLCKIAGVHEFTMMRAEIENVLKKARGET